MRIFGLNTTGTVNHCDSGQLIADIKRALKKRETFHTHSTKRVAALQQECLKNIGLLCSMSNERRMLWHKVNVSSARFILSENRYYNRLRRLLSGQVPFDQIVRKLLSAFGWRAKDCNSPR